MPTKIKLKKQMHSQKHSLKNIHINIHKSSNKYHIKPELTINTLKDIYKECNIIYQSTTQYYDVLYINTLLEFIINYYLLLKGERDIFQVFCIDKTYAIIDKYILSKYNINFNDKHYKIFENVKYIRLVVYNPKKINIDELDINFGKKFANQLGKFYVCAKNDTENLKNTSRIKIVANLIRNLPFYKNIENIEIYAQDCKNNTIANTENYSKFMKIFVNIKKLLEDLDIYLTVSFTINS